MKKLLIVGLVLTLASFVAMGFTQQQPRVFEMPEVAGDAIVKAAYNETEIAITFSWMSTKPYAGQFHDMVRFDGEAWDRLPSSERLQEDRISFMISELDSPVDYFDTSSCYAACHSDLNRMPGQLTDADGAPVDARHYVLVESEDEAGQFGLDMWHWRAGRSGPMGYAEDTWVRTHLFETGAQGRQRDALGDMPTNWTRDGGDRFREDQAWGGDLEWNGTPLPRFVFNPEKATFGNYFLSSLDGELFTEPEQLFTIQDAQYGSLKVIYQDLDFDPVDKVNAIDIAYLLYLVGDWDAEEYRGDWEAFWADQLGIDDADGAAAMLDDIVATMQPGVMVTRSVGFIYPSSQHDIRSTHDFDYEAGVWTVTMYRNLTTSTADADDVDLEDMLDGDLFTLGFAVHDVNDGGMSHFISFPYTLGGADSGADIEAVFVDDVWAVDWDALEGFAASMFDPPAVSLDDLLNPDIHSSARRLSTWLCQDCHYVGEELDLLLLDD